MSEGFDYGNTRVRARRAELLNADRYRQLVALDVDRLGVALSDTPYRPDIEAATPRHRGSRLVDEAVRTNLARTLRELTSWYDGAAAADLSLVVERWDLRNVRAILRGQHARSDPDDIRGALVPAGRLGDDVLGELAGQAGLRPTVELMFAWGVPNADVVRAAVGALPDLEETGDFQAFERTVERAAAHRLRASLDAAEPEVSAVLRAEIDQINLLSALRLLQARSGPDDWDDAAERFLDGGVIPLPFLARVAGAEDRSAVVAMLAEAPVPATWQQAVARWGESGDLVALDDELDEIAARVVTGMFATADPLGPGVPLAFVWAKENEVKNLRTIAAGLAAGRSAEEIEEELVIL
jgi:V/A-type H+-transporting ATPase subunit C